MVPHEIFGKNIHPKGGLISESFSSWLQSQTTDARWGNRLHCSALQCTARPKINSQSQIFRCSQSIFCLPHRPKFSDFFDLCLHWVSVVRDVDANANFHSYMTWQKQWIYIYVQQRIAYKKMCPETPTSITTYIVDEFI